MSSDPPPDPQTTDTTTIRALADKLVLDAIAADRLPRKIELTECSRTVFEEWVEHFRAKRGDPRPSAR